MIVLATDFGLEGPYVGQVKACLARQAPGVPAIDLFADLPAFQPKLAAYLLAAYASVLAANDVLLAVVDSDLSLRRLEDGLESRSKIRMLRDVLNRRAPTRFGIVGRFS